MREGATAALVCETAGGDPLPRISWWRGKTVIDDVVEEVGGGNALSIIYKGQAIRSNFIRNNGTCAGLKIHVCKDLIRAQQSSSMFLCWWVYLSDIDNNNFFMVSHKTHSECDKTYISKLIIQPMQPTM